MRETWYEFKVLEKLEGEDTERLLTPHANPDEYEYPLDFLFDTPEKATAWLKEYVEDGNIEQEEADTFVLVRKTLEVVDSSVYALVNDSDGNDTTELEAKTYEEALEEAVEALGYFISEGDKE